jgi:excisionase family DNA binding protein
MDITSIRGPTGLQSPPCRPPARTYSARHVAELFQVDLQTIYRWLRAGVKELPRPTRIGRRYLFNANAIDALLGQGVASA